MFKKYKKKLKKINIRAIDGMSHVVKAGRENSGVYVSSSNPAVIVVGSRWWGVEELGNIRDPRAHRFGTDSDSLTLAAAELQTSPAELLPQVRFPGSARKTRQLTQKIR